jgi:predicted RND superfamily exporter protein
VAAERRRGLGAAPRLGRLAAVSVAHPWRVLAVTAVLVAVSAGWAAGHLRLATSNLDLVDRKLPPVAAFRDFAREFGTPNLLVVVLEGGDPAALAAAVDRLEPRLAALPGVLGVEARLPWSAQTLRRFGAEPYFTSRDRRLFFLFVQPDDPDSSAAALAPFVSGVRQALAEAHLESSGIHAGLTGLPKYALDDKEVIQRDIGSLSVLAFLLVLGLFVAAFASFLRPLAAMAALLAAVGVLLGPIAVYPGHLTLLSAFFASILFGLGVDYGIHVIDRVEELLAAGTAERQALVAAVESLAPGLATGALTTAFAFFSLDFCGFRGFEELGVIAGMGVLVCLLAMVTVLPALLALTSRRPAATRAPRRRPQRRLGRLLVRLQHPVTAVLVGGAALVAPLAGGPGFDTDYLNLQPKGSETVRLERQMVEGSGLSPQFAAFVTGSRREAAELTARLRRDTTVGEVHSVADLDLLAALGAAPEPGRADQLEELRRRFESPAGRFAVYAYPDGDVWDAARQAEFLAHMRAVAPQVTGMPILGNFMIARSQRALKIAAVLSSLTILLWVAADFRKLRWTAAAVLPTFAGMAAMVGLMRLFGVPFNPLNVLALPVVLGIAVDDGVHIVHRFLAEGGALGPTLVGTGRSVVLTSLTSIAAFGALAWTSHRGLASFALALTLGVAAVLVLSVLVLPQVLVWMTARGPGKVRKVPDTSAVYPRNPNPNPNPNP